MPNHNDLRDYMQRVKTKDPDGFRWLQERNRAAVAAGQKAQTVVDHPGWQEYVRRVEEALVATRANREVAIRRLVALDSVGDDLLALKFLIKSFDGGIAAFETVLEFIPEILDQAAEAANELERA